MRYIHFSWPTSFLLLIFTSFDHQVSAHGMCWNNNSPVSVSPPLQFCTEFAGFGCCERNGKEKEIQKQIDTFTEKVPEFKDKEECLDMIKQLMCQKCSHYSGHMFDFNLESPLPGICPSHCELFHTKCPKLIEALVEQNWQSLKKNIHSLASKADFCGYFQTKDNDYCFPDVKTNKFLTGEVATIKKDVKDCLCLQQLTNDQFMVPVQTQHVTDGSNRIFIAVLSGIIYTYYSNGTQSQKANVFLNIEENVFKRTVLTKGDIGFLGFTFHPRFSENGRFYAMYSLNGPDFIPSFTRVSEFTVPESQGTEPLGIQDEKVIMDIPVSYKHHVGGQLLFGDDGYLYIFMGDAAEPYDPEGHSQNMSLLLGKALRIDVDSEENGKPYGIPYDNPFVHDPSVRPEIFAYGFRNPWRCGLDRGDSVSGEGKGRIICTDVGEAMYEEINLLKKGANYGWNIVEGPVCHKTEKCNGGKLEKPIFSYKHTVGKSVSGGVIYRGCDIPHLQGSFIYGDWMTGRLFKLTEEKPTGQWESKELFMCNECPAPLTNTYPLRILSISEDEQGEIYLATMKKTYKADGKVFKVVDPKAKSTCETEGRGTRVEEMDQTSDKVIEPRQTSDSGREEIVTLENRLLENSKTSPSSQQSTAITGQKYTPKTQETLMDTQTVTANHSVQNKKGMPRKQPVANDKRLAKDNQTTANNQTSTDIQGAQGRELPDDISAISNEVTTTKGKQWVLPAGINWLGFPDFFKNNEEKLNSSREHEHLFSSYGSTLFAKTKGKHDNSTHSQLTSPGQTNAPTSPGQTNVSTSPGQTNAPTSPGQTIVSTSPGQTNVSTSAGQTNMSAINPEMQGTESIEYSSILPAKPPTGDDSSFPTLGSPTKNVVHGGGAELQMSTTKDKDLTTSITLLTKFRERMEEADNAHHVRSHEQGTGNNGTVIYCKDGFLMIAFILYFLFTKYVL